MKLCPQDGLANALYLKPLVKFHDKAWYSKSPVGHNTLSRLVKNVMETAGFKGQFTNHSLRATTVTRLFDGQQDVKVIKEQTGHRSDAVLSYRRVNDSKKQQVTRIISEATHPPSANSDEETEVLPAKRVKLEEHSTSTAEDRSDMDRRAPCIFNISGGNVTIKL